MKPGLKSPAGSPVEGGFNTLFGSAEPSTCGRSSGSVRKGGFGCSSFFRCSNSTNEDFRSCSSFSSGSYTSSQVSFNISNSIVDFATVSACARIMKGDVMACWLWGSEFEYGSIVRRIRGVDGISLIMRTLPGCDDGLMDWYVGKTD